jgi:hypothetical protein
MSETPSAKLHVMSPPLEAISPELAALIPNQAVHLTNQGGRVIHPPTGSAAIPVAPDRDNGYSLP